MLIRGDGISVVFLLLALTRCQDSFYFWTLQERLRCSLPVAACGQRLYIARGPSTRGPNY